MDSNTYIRLVDGDLTWKDYMNSLSPEDLEKQREYDRNRLKKWYERNKEQKLSYCKEYYDDNKEEIMKKKKNITQLIRKEF